LIFLVFTKFKRLGILIQTHSFFDMRPPSPSPLPAGERDGVRGESVGGNEI